MDGSFDNIRKFILFSLVFHVLISFAWGKIVVQKSVPIHGDHIEVSLKHFELKKPAPAKKVVQKKKVTEKKKQKVPEKVEKRDDSLALKKQEKPQASEETEQVYATARPSYGHTPRPRYPSRAIMRGYEGSVLLNVHVLPNGEPDEVTVVQSSGYKILDKAALTAVKKWKFQPAQRGFKAVSSWVKVPIEFRLEGD
ncbi:MAG: energy transducer TonB [Candidatus Dadabacteria bacterium]|nr:energy transducer TonB [Candidatus Dadabacteria bacterium]MCY4262567.1 energy transducer TonB [Candidatus Dadabacteria bacterium]